MIDLTPRPEGGTTPVASIVVVAYGRRDTLASLLASLETAHATDDGGNRPEVIVVDNGSPDDTVDWLRTETRGVTVVALGRNAGFAAGCNAGLLAATTPVIVFVNSDVEVSPGWLEPLLDAVARPGVAAAGPVSTDTDGAVTEAGLTVGVDGAIEAMRAGSDGGGPVGHLSASTLAVRRRDLLAVGGFDPAFGLGYHEDVDLLAALGAAGCGAPVLVGDVTVVHRRGASFGPTASQELARRNLRRSQARWGWSRRRVAPSLRGGLCGALRLRGRVLVLASPSPERESLVTELVGHHVEVGVADPVHAAPTRAGLDGVDVVAVDAVLHLDGLDAAWLAWLRREAPRAEIGPASRRDEILRAAGIVRSSVAPVTAGHMGRWQMATADLSGPHPPGLDAETS